LAQAAGAYADYGFGHFGLYCDLGLRRTQMNSFRGSMKNFTDIYEGPRFDSNQNVEDNNSVATAAADADCDAKSCCVCGAKLRTGLLEWTYICRICGRTACAKCAPSTIQLQGWPTSERCCTPCASLAQQGPMIKNKLAVLGAQLRFLGGIDSLGTSATTTIEESVASCEEAMPPVKKVCESVELYKRRLENAEAAIAEVMDALVQEGIRAKATAEALQRAERNVAENQSKSKLLAQEKTVEKSSSPPSCFGLC